jgi:hypothetical protein
MRLPLFFGLALAATAPACSGDPNPAAGSPPVVTLAPGPASGDRVLFVGNSLTEGNALHLIVEAVAAAGGHPLATESLTYPGVALEDHWRLGTPDRIAAGGWKYVVLQQGPSALADSRANLREWTRRFDDLIRRQGGTTALYMVWPESYRQQAFGDVAASYRLAAQDVGGVLLPVGEAWLAAWRRDRDLRLYGSDGFHPTPLASYLAAVTIYGGLTGASPVGLPSRLRLRDGQTLDLPAREVEIVQAAAEEVLP